MLIDEICRGTETAKGTCIAGSIVENLDKIGCLGIVSTHLHGIFDLPLDTKTTVHKAMGTVYADGETRPTWKLTDGVCRESLAFETAVREGMPEEIIQRAKELYRSAYVKEVLLGEKKKAQKEKPRRRPSLNGSDVHSGGEDPGKSRSLDRTEILQKEVETICRRKLIELYKDNASEFLLVCVSMGAKELPPPSTVGASCVYVMLRPENKIYVGQVRDTK